MASPEPDPPSLTAEQTAQACAVWLAFMRAGTRQAILTRHSDGRVTLDPIGRRIDIPQITRHTVSTSS